MAIVTDHQDWLENLREPLDAVIHAAQAYAFIEGRKPPTERQFADALNAIRYYRWQVRAERDQQKRAAQSGAVSE